MRRILGRPRDEERRRQLLGPQRSGADEYAIGVTDNAFTNGAARRALEAAVKAAEACGERPDPAWAEVAARLRIERFPDGTTREHADYDGEQIKQADANLLGWPLGITSPTAGRCCATCATTNRKSTRRTARR